MRILLIRYYSSNMVNTPMSKSVVKAEGVAPPLGLAYVAASLESQGYTVAILDCVAFGLTKAEVRAKIKKYDPGIVGITCTTPNVPGIIEISKIVKSVNAEIKVVLGGPHLSIFPKESLQFPFIDFGVIGEGEYSFVELADAIDKGSKDFSGIRGIVWKRGRTILVNPPREPITDLDALPFPARHLLPNELYDLVIMQYPIATMIASRGCPYHCAYCFKEPHTRYYRTRNPAQVVDEMEQCVERHKIREISVYDDCWPNKKLLSGICTEIVKRGLDIRWNALQRVNLATKDSLDMMEKAGCVLVKYGVESGSQRILDFMNKGITIKQIETAFKNTKEAGLKSFAFFMTGYATETGEDFHATLNLAKKIEPDWVVFDVTVPFPSTKLWSWVVEHQGFDPNYWHNWSLGKVKKALPPIVPEAEEWCKIAHREFYLRPGHIFKKVMTIRNARDFKKYLIGGMALLKFVGRDKKY